MGAAQEQVPRFQHIVFFTVSNRHPMQVAARQWAAELQCDAPPAQGQCGSPLPLSALAVSVLIQLI